jgi:hypothetical protein
MIAELVSIRPRPLVGGLDTSGSCLRPGAGLALDVLGEACFPPTRGVERTRHRRITADGPRRSLAGVDLRRQPPRRLDNVGSAG